MNPNCTICGKTAVYLIEKDGYKEYECPNCYLSFVYPEPDQAFLSNEVYSEKSGYQSNKKPDLEAAVLVKKHRKVIDYLSTQPKGNLLDVGCSNGELIYNAKKIGYTVKGLELNPRTAAMAQANGLDVFNGLLEDAKYPDRAFDYVYMGDLIEHVTDPASLLKETNRILRPGGQLIILTPNMDCFWARSTYVLYKIFKIPWSVITPPYHLFQFSKHNLALLLEKNGFKERITWYVNSPSLKYELGSLHLLKRWKKSKRIGDLLFMVFSFVLYGVLFVVNRLVEFLPTKRFAMAMVAQKND